MAVTRRELLAAPLVLLAQPECAKPGFVVASGTLSAAGHEQDAGYAEIGTAVLFLHPNDPRREHVRALWGQPVELVLRPVEPRKREELVR